ncbi:MAG: DUF6268 family outer membrane beta-barrel protein, partial [Rothia sp. (in: high G+C Gram-positive bacteria)]|uniref:DUF6268 family outer membrane beta-barrel protein n=1 Tax=Rothia sp. (in: high G+C Gram-positive bacteria) TaxID=1885016 RepID=UPI0026E0F0D4
FAVKPNPKGMPAVWSATLSGLYAQLDNTGSIAAVSPDQVLNLSLNLSHLRPLSTRWYLMASLGAGIYAPPSDIRWSSILANGAVIFAYKLRSNLDVGLGLGLTNSYGVPLVMPMGFLKWTTTGRYEVKVEMAGSLKAQVGCRLGERFRLTLVPFDMDGFSAVVHPEGKSRIYGATRMRAYLQPEWAFTPHAFAYLGAGMELYHSIKLSERSLRGFTNNFSGGEHWKRARGLHLMGGVKYRF